LLNLLVDNCAKGPPSWIYLYGWPVYYSSGSTSSAAAHLAKRLKGHGVNVSSPVTAPIDLNQGTLIALMRENNMEVSQSVANRISASFGTRRFQDALIAYFGTSKQASISPSA
jgi:hypothetical protein